MTLIPSFKGECVNDKKITSLKNRAQKSRSAQIMPLKSFKIG